MFNPSKQVRIDGVVYELKEALKLANDLDLVEVNPLLGSNEHDINKTVFSAMRAILSFFGYNTIGTITPMQKIPKPRTMQIIDKEIGKING
jgi:hypothetical protein